MEGNEEYRLVLFLNKFADFVPNGEACMELRGVQHEVQVFG